MLAVATEGALLAGCVGGSLPWAPLVLFQALPSPPKGQVGVSWSILGACPWVNRCTPHTCMNTKRPRPATALTSTKSALFVFTLQWLGALKYE